MQFVKQNARQTMRALHLPPRHRQRHGRKQDVALDVKRAGRKREENVDDDIISCSLNANVAFCRTP